MVVKGHLQQQVSVALILTTPGGRMSFRLQSQGLLPLDELEAH